MYNVSLDTSSYISYILILSYILTMMVFKEYHLAIVFNTYLNSEVGLRLRRLIVRFRSFYMK